MKIHEYKTINWTKTNCQVDEILNFVVFSNSLFISKFLTFMFKSIGAVVGDSSSDCRGKILFGPVQRHRTRGIKCFCFVMISYSIGFVLWWFSPVLERGFPARHEANDEYIVAPSSGRQFVCRYRAMQTEFVWRLHRVKSRKHCHLNNQIVSFRSWLPKIKNDW